MGLVFIQRTDGACSIRKHKTDVVRMGLAPSTIKHKMTRRTDVACLHSAYGWGLLHPQT
jgi:hypothetical protein